jgi:hypothetical protein
MAILEPEPTGQSGQTADKEVKASHFIAYGSGYTIPDPTIYKPADWVHFSRCSKKNKVTDFYLLVWSLSRLLCRFCLRRSRTLRRRSATAHLLISRVRFLPGAWMSVFCDFCLLSRRDLCFGLVTRPEKSYRVWCV